MPLPHSSLGSNVRRTHMAGVLLSAVVANRAGALRADNGVLHAPGRIATVGARKRDGSAFDGVLACRIVLRDNGHFTA